MSREPESLDALEITLGRILGIGVKTSAATLAAGLLLSLARGAGTLSEGLLITGIVLLIATPVARVFFSCVAYLRKRDWTFAVLTLIVLAELLASIVAAIRARP